MNKMMTYGSAVVCALTASDSTRVQDQQALARVKVGDRLDITWTEALILSLENGK